MNIVQNSNLSEAEFSGLVKCILAGDNKDLSYKELNDMVQQINLFEIDIKIRAVLRTIFDKKYSFDRQ